jgi:hypothetical protein
VRPLGDVYLGMAIAFNSMPEYVKKMLQRFRPQYLLPGDRPPRTPGVYIAPSLSKKPQTVFIDRLEKLSPALVTELQAIIGTLLYYARAVDPTLLPIANKLASQQANASRRVPQRGQSRPQLLRLQQQPDRLLPHMRHGITRDCRCLIPVSVSRTIRRRSYLLP